ncbi:cell death abnormality protein 1-like [Saccostrea echinata]|uniref:cell death abnormality protein 1-like n=1 Tax=Saccostrea echinata TaxID=191078 RepID=UPI002A829138|nr:cell death abnormality protein 1-like [Saccostrea echinata]
MRLNLPVGSPTLSTKTQDSSNGFIPKISRAPNSAANVCLTGYQGDNCDIKCRYPNYGDGCQSICLCEKEHCYHDTGCKGSDERTTNNFTFNDVHVTNGVSSSYSSLSTKMIGNMTINDIDSSSKESSLPFSIRDEVCKEWDSSQNKCAECNTGYFGQNCRRPCRYPNYGKGCQMRCNCEKENCSSKTGCEDGSLTVSPDEVPNISNMSLPEFTIPVFYKVCPPGYFGERCKLPCRYPNYGIECQLKCKCRRPGYCDHVKGCLDSSRLCSNTKHPGRRDAMLYSTIVLCIIAIFQFIFYIYLSFFYKTRLHLVCCTL